jgi:ribosomal protein S12 methylthiotransferase
VKYRTGFVNGAPVRTRMTELVQELSKLGVWVRLHYVYPYPHVDEVLPLMAEGKILPYLDVPFQHASPRVLKAMKRPASGEKNIDRIRAWRDICPDLTIRSTFIAGFPGETEAEFEYLLDFLREAQLDRVGCFAYSPVEGASANELPGALPDDVRQERQQRFMEVQSDISAARLERRVGTSTKILIDGVDLKNGQVIGRSGGEAPDIDGVIIAQLSENTAKTKKARVALLKQKFDSGELKVGGFASVQIDAAGEHDLFATLIVS